jgi:hypothetical protein
LAETLKLALAPSTALASSGALVMAGGGVGITEPMSTTKPGPAERGELVDLAQRGLAPASNHRFTNSRSSTVICVALFIGMALSTTAC